MGYGQMGRGAYVPRRNGPRVSSPPSEKQLAFLRRLMNDVGEDVEAYLATAPTKAEVSAKIDGLIAAERERAKARMKIGYYVGDDDEVYAIVPTRDGSNLYAKHLTMVMGRRGMRWTWEYAPNVARDLDPDEVTTWEDAAARTGVVASEVKRLPLDEEPFVTGPLPG